MLDPRTKKPVTLLRGEGVGGSFQIPVARKDEVHAALDRHGVPYWDSGIEFTADGGPWFMSIRLSVKADAGLVQRLLDALP